MKGRGSRGQGELFHDQGPLFGNQRFLPHPTKRNGNGGGSESVPDLEKLRAEKIAQYKRNIMNIKKDIAEFTRWIRIMKATKSLAVLRAAPNIEVSPFGMFGSLGSPPKAR